MMIFFIRWFLSECRAIFDNRVVSFVLFTLKTIALAELFGLTGRMDNMYQSTFVEVSVDNGGTGYKKSIHFRSASGIRYFYIFILVNKAVSVGRSHQDIIKSILFGVAVGDALGVSAEFRSREELRAHPVTGMEGYGKHGQPPGTWSDDSSLSFCLAEALTEGFDLKAIAQNFVRWRQEGFWTARGSVFDIGGTTSRAITRLAAGVKPETAGDDDENSNGNGSLMRILPLLLYIAEKPAGERFRITQQVSSLTHRHMRSVTACFIYLELARYLSIGMKKSDAYKSVRVVTAGHLSALNVPKEERRLFDRLLKGNIQDMPEERIKSTGYVLDTLEASIWCLMTTESYREAVLKAVNLGEDSDTTGAVTGGLAGLLYGFKSIPEEWINMLARKDDIDDLAARVKRAGYKEIKN